MTTAIERVARLLAWQAGAWPEAPMDPEAPVPRPIWQGYTELAEEVIAALPPVYIVATTDGCEAAAFADSRAQARAAAAKAVEAAVGELVPASAFRAQPAELVVPGYTTQTVLTDRLQQAGRRLLGCG